MFKINKIDFKCIFLDYCILKCFNLYEIWINYLFSLENYLF